jgi:hypothetical protein
MRVEAIFLTAIRLTENCNIEIRDDLCNSSEAIAHQNFGSEYPLHCITTMILYPCVSDDHQTGTYEQALHESYA